MKLHIAGAGLILVAAIGWSATTAFSQSGMDEPEGCCWLHGWEEAGFMGGDSVLRGPGEWPSWDDQFHSVEVGSCAKVTVWLEEEFKGESLELLTGEQRTEFDGDRYKSMKMACE